MDTGASVSMLHPSIFDVLPSEITMNKCDLELCSANGESIPVLGSVVLNCNLGKFAVLHKFIVAEITHQGILGADILGTYSANLDLSGKTLTLTGQKIDLIEQRQCCGEATVYSLQNITVPPSSEMTIPVYKRKGDNTGECLIESNVLSAGNSEDGLIFGRTLVDVSKKILPVRVINPGTFPIKILKGSCISQIHPVTQVLSDLEQKDEATKVLHPVVQEMFDKQSTEFNSEEKKIFHALLCKHQSLFAKDPLDIGYCDWFPYEIDTGDAKPIRQKSRRVSPHLRPEIEKCVSDMLKSGIITPSQSPWASPIVMVKKPDNTWRFCVDYRKLNEVTKVDAWPLPRIDETLDSLQGNRYFSNMDLISGYHNVAVDTRSREKTAFTTGTSLYEFRVLPFGVVNAPSAFSRLMEYVLTGLQFSACLIYLDDVISFGRTFEEAAERLDLVFTALKKAGLKLKPSKCSFFQKQVEYLGFIVSEQGISTNPKKTEKVKTWPVPRTLKQARGFTGLTSYYRKFIPEYSRKAAPLHQLTKKGVKFVWTTECQAAFEELKEDLCRPPVLAFPDFSLPFILDTDASNGAISGIISQVQGGQERVIAYASRTLSPSERNYSVTRRELLAVVHFVKYFKPYLLGKRFLLRTDHGSLRWLYKSFEVEGQVARWIEILSTFQFDIEHRPGRLHGNADAFTRIPDESEVGHEGRVGSVSFSGFSYSRDEIKEKQKDDSCLGLVYRLKEEFRHRPPPEKFQTASRETKLYLSQWDQIVMENGLLFRVWTEKKEIGDRKLLIIPRILQQEVLYKAHDAIIGGHLGVFKTLCKVRQKYWWIGLRTSVRKYIRKCTVCARRKCHNKTPRAALNTRPVGYPLERIAMDIKGPLPVSNHGNRYILVISDYFTKFSEAYAIPNQEAETIANKICQEWVSRYGTPRQCHSDCGQNLQGRVVQHLCKVLGIHKIHTVPYNPKSDGQVERLNKTIGEMLSAYVQSNQLDWDDHLPFVMMAYRASIQESTGFSPNKLMFGRENNSPLCTLLEPSEDQHFLTVENYLQQLDLVLSLSFDFVRKHLKIAHERQKTYYDKKVHGEPYTVGDLVWKAIKRIQRGRTWSLSPHFDGPYEVLEVLSDVNYRIQKVGGRKSMVEHFDHLKPYHGDPSSTWTEENLNEREVPVETGESSNTEAESIPEEVTEPILPTGRPVRRRRLPDKYGTFVRY